MNKQYELVGIGNALVDIIAKADDQFLEAHNIIKGAMSLIDAQRAHALYGAVDATTMLSGGSAANTMAGFASFGGRCAYMGKIANDSLGEIFAADMERSGIFYKNLPLMNSVATGRCTIIVTPDAERSMSTYLGASVEFGEDDVDEKLIANAQMIYMEGYLFDKPAAKKAFLKASRTANETGGKVSLTLSDTFCVDRHRNDFRILIETGTNVLFSNEAEIIELYQAQNLEEALSAVRGKCDICVVTRGAKGSVILAGEHVFEVSSIPVDRLEDTTGAGDQYAAGFLFGLSRGFELPLCGEIASLAASEVISHLGPRPQTSLSALAQTHLGLKLAV